ncbi:GNAT family N-acetyltransferase [Candidatus Woesearchaeota archaeon]|nr:GNAT family N-acetyltransferase [Candidatus Woesearchaeota archaeon]
MIIRNVFFYELGQVANLERVIEGEHAASLVTLCSRFRMHPSGFYVAREEGRTVGYIESCRWDRTDFERFDEIENFPANHNPTSKTSYVIFVGVDPAYRRRGIGSALVRTIQRDAQREGLEGVQLVAKNGLVDFYVRLGFEVVRPMPDFLPYVTGTLMVYDAKHTIKNF